MKQRRLRLAGNPAGPVAILRDGFRRYTNRVLCLKHGHVRSPLSYYHRCMRCGEGPSR